MLTALSQTIRTYLGPHKTSNPTWLKHPPDTADRISIPESHFLPALVAAVGAQANLLHPAAQISACTRPATIKCGDATKLPLSTATADIVITSPPYCTRIDYVISTAPELALLRLTPTDVSALREQSLGTPTIHSQPSNDTALKNYKLSIALLQQIRSHQSKCSASYYYKTYLQYLTGFASSLQELNRVLRPGGHCVIVIQDSYYKTIHVDLAAITLEITESLQWTQTDRLRFKCPRAIRQFSKSASRQVLPEETVLILQKRA